jgi:hypothetical protein
MSLWKPSNDRMTHKSKKETKACRFFSSRGSPAPNIERKIRLKLKGKRPVSTSGRSAGGCGRWPEVDTYESVHLGNKWTLRSGQTQSPLALCWVPGSELVTALPYSQYAQLPPLRISDEEQFLSVACEEHDGSGC